LRSALRDFAGKKIIYFNHEALLTDRVKRSGKRSGHLNLWTIQFIPMHVKEVDSGWQNLPWWSAHAVVTSAVPSGGRRE
jgi:hypothetical protein